MLLLGKSRSERLAVAIGAVFLLWAVLWQQSAFGGEPSVKPVEPGVAAKVDDQIITLEELEKVLAPQLAKLQEQRFQLMETKLEELIEERLLALEAKRRGITVEDLLKAEVTSKAPEVSDAEVATFMTQNRARLQGDDAELRPKVRDYLRNQKAQAGRHAYLASLQQRAKVEWFLEEPDPIRVPVSAEGAFAQGPKDAPVTIVEFSDFQCPFCSRVVGTLKEVVRLYPKQVRLAYRDFPIAGLHPKAAKAAEAARCAGEQGKFWEYHDRLFESQAQATPADFKRFAEQLKLNDKSFAACLDGGKHAAAVQADVEEGTRLGITGTPTFFINGRLVVGALPLEMFQKIIDRELRRQPK
ncbi:Disulfide bond formation protein D precursor [Candidatus Methylomirabilis lanthanidiphila]|uniref:Disulfide bond formation protein D n=1 Tax=Candidatus Methylomirabilis lanthanidiphila TaxID=2211376 RepID=A0A564ZFU9_9BACT|nr:thioredoxin domain-containing protein [Candidatus Methylomirabilis lanthanidiphila]VUZ84190.1 Disulfide bond formation protein D precursor [Candidatus Methylomirabilis lanthanidiphila]